MPRKIDRPPLRNDYWPFETRPAPCECEACRPILKGERTVRTPAKVTQGTAPKTLPVR